VIDIASSLVGGMCHVDKRGILVENDSQKVVSVLAADQDTDNQAGMCMTVGNHQFHYHTKRLG
jgi:hypothetical protein